MRQLILVVLGLYCMGICQMQKHPQLIRQITYDVQYVFEVIRQNF
jgi:hypothetical protein